GRPHSNVDNVQIRQWQSPILSAWTWCNSSTGRAALYGRARQLGDNGPRQVSIEDHRAACSIRHAQVWAVDADACLVTAASTAARQHLAEHGNVLDLIHPEDRELALRIKRTMATEHRSVTGCCRLRHPGGGFRNTLWYAEP